MAAPRDYSRAALTAQLGVEVMAHLDQLAAASPDPHPDEVAMLRRLFQRPIQRRARAERAATAA
ncbi:hypothetical protein B4N89_02515 [Embleya scabrispora]|uniref:Uncharacterized protein n=1 Tax=Embleya scabrispora TaxID=159449 RepID=A0A1T3NTF8_9ACTN|nr:hypothetical protein [Embleya scabrispora]OPC79970.1 hypothetical protein B4N89_02515 [Embleya scabrispora]